MKLPYAFTGPYSQAYVLPDMAMDPRHVFMLHGILKAWPFKLPLEIGSFWGASSTAFVEAINGGADFTATFCDVDLTDGLRNVAGNCRDPGRVRLTADHSWDVLESPEPFDFILLDANHDLESVKKETARLAIRQPLCLMAHDTNASAAGYARAEGAAHLKQAFEAMPQYRCIEDCRKRDGEQTERGLFLATTDADLFRVAQDVFKEWQ